ncbi:MAG: tetratricopeptide repeat protein [Alistipes sp.]|nr:tetratricopeptide repeat protein [Alistipes sp.]
MREVRNILAVVVALFVVVGSAHAADKRTTAEVCWKEGIAAYEDGDYARAVDNFERVIELGEVSADIYYNLAGAYFKLGQEYTPGVSRHFAGGELGRAVLNYHRALKLNPAMEDARYNLDIAVDHTNDTEAVPDSFIATMWIALRNTMTSNAWTVVSLVALVLTFMLVLFYLLSERMVLRKVGFFTAMACMVVVIVATALALSSRSAVVEDERAVVVCNDTTPVHASPDSASKIIRRPSQGVTVSMLRSHGDWSEVLFLDGEKGWIRSSYIEMI